MHSKTHYKLPFKSSKISTVSVKIIFFLNTTLPREHYQIYFTIFKLPNWRSKNYKTVQTLELNELSYTLTAADRWDLLDRGPTRQ